MKSYCLKCIKDIGNIDPKVFKTINNGTMCKMWNYQNVYYQNVQNVEAKNQDSLKIKKQKDY